MKLTLTRDYSGQDCTQGVLRVGDFEYQTMERPWVEQLGAPCGKKGVSCIPPGTYQLERHDSEAHPRTFALVNPEAWVYHWDEDVPGGQRNLARTLVLVHPANFPEELRGCVAPGKGRAMSPRRMVTNSRKAMEEILSMVPWMDGAHEVEIA